ncbi:DNA helicase-2 / ATP-dependent DNA helicase PcrA [Pseudobutyrivibrio sp. UC1225]|uniref:ATP-dependent helicase n=1 Tax=Pseudobutyrivibrio sp. UC1225 TaxID=1798185 RepID=UPI0008E78BC0|nr:ATP-dependent helicase [Pseudobutyrivibrio sp. UC1225]SFN47688.1 DNA helicase-2 / ATP-dependent DNA helicase PcrA [Pseudobutyrivibrio sp. UC1225]
MNLNATQRQAVLHKEGPCLVIAGPGSGKTAVLTQRVRELINSGIPAEQVLVITFTKAAAIEMKERFEGLSEEKAPVTFGTFHSLFWGIIQKELGYKNSDIIMGQMRERIWREALHFAKDDEKEAKKKYQQLKDKYHVVDFDDMLTKAYKLFILKPEVLKKWQSRFSYFLVDEMQDMNDLQFKLITMLSARTNNLFCVGDDDQSIYGFRGANPKIMQDFMEIYPKAQKIILDYNYRNPVNLVEAAGRLISVNKNRFSKDIKSTAPEGNILVEEHFSPEEEAKAIIEQLISLKDTGYDYDKIAILYRNHSDARYVVDKLVNASIPFYLKEQMPNIYSHFIINDIETYFQISIGNITKARILGILNRPNRFLHRQSLEKGSSKKAMLDFYRTSPYNYRTVEALWTDIELISKMSPVAAISYIRKAMGYDTFLVEEAVKKQVEVAEYYEILDFLTEVFRESRTIRQAIDKLNILRLKIDYENKNMNVDKTGKVGLYTLHSSKGLEFENVFIISANDGIIPSNKVESREDMEGERRLFYVGITRSKKNLYISYTNKKNRDKSRFLDEMKL